MPCGLVLDCKDRFIALYFLLFISYLLHLCYITKPVIHLPVCAISKADDVFGIKTNNILSFYSARYLRKKSKEKFLAL